MKASLSVAAALAVLCSSAWAQEPNASPQQDKCGKKRRDGSC